MQSSSSDLAMVLELIKQAKAHGITEVTYGDLKVRFSPQAAESGSGPVTQRGMPAPLTWGTTLKTPEEK